jgi:hypothetical protein
VLHTPNIRAARREFCGPTAIAAVTGIHISDIRDAIHQARGDIRATSGAHMPIAGMNNKDLLATMAVLGWHVSESWSAPKVVWEAVEVNAVVNRMRRKNFKSYTLAEFAKEYGAGGPFIVNVTGHYVAISEGEFCDTYSEVPVDLDRAMKRKGRAGKWIKNWWCFEQSEAA